MRAILRNTANRVRKALTANQPKVFVNEAVNLSKAVIFIAIPKTGTSSVRSQLRQDGVPLVPNPHLDAVQIRELMYAYGLIGNLGRNRDFPQQDKFNNASVAETAKSLFDRCFKFSAVRNPWARAVSLYSRREGVQVRDRMTFQQFCEQHQYASDTCTQPTTHRNQSDWLQDEDGNDLIDFVYKVEEFENAIERIREMTNGRLVLKNIKKNRNPRSRSTSYRDMYNARTKKLIASTFQKDIETYEYTF